MGLEARSSEAKTRPTAARPADFIDGLADPRRQRESRTLVAMMERVTGERAVMWGPSIVGFGTYHYV